MLLQDLIKTIDTKFHYHSLFDGCNNSTQKTHLHQQRKAALADAADVGLISVIARRTLAPTVRDRVKQGILREQQQLFREHRYFGTAVVQPDKPPALFAADDRAAHLRMRC